MTERKEKNQGMNWISQHKRLAIYLRDGLACCYCGAGVTEGAQLTLDHIQPYSKGGSNHERNLITCCNKCNSSRGNRELLDFVDATANYINNGIVPADILNHITACIGRELNIEQSKKLINRQGSCFKVLKLCKCTRSQ